MPSEKAPDDDADWLLEIANNKLRYDTDDFKARLRAIATRLQAKASETSEKPLNMCAHGADRGSYCGYCGGYSQGAQA